MRIRTKLALHLAVQVVLVALAVAALLHLAAAYRELEQAQSRRFEAQQLAAELYQSSNELSLMARLFVLRREPRYARYYSEIGRIRDGQAPRPPDYDAAYWDLRLADPQRAEGPGQPASLQQRMRAAGFSATELALLDEAQRNSEALMEVELRAMGPLDKPAGAAVAREALELVHGPAYLRAKAAIAAPLRRLNESLAQRLEAERAAAGTRVQRASWLACAALLLLGLHALWSSYRFDRSVRQPLAVLRDWAQSVRAGRHGSRTGLSLDTEFGELSAVIDEMADAVEHSLADLREEVQRRTRAEEVVQHLANHDALTGLPSLRLLHDRLERALARAQREEEGVALLFIDLNGFKPVNDLYGHESGDMVLKVVGQRLSGALRDADTVGRIGGDEFLVVLSDVADHADAVRVRDKLDVLLRQPIYLPRHKLVVQVSAAMGIALYPAQAQDATSLLRLADEDMYRQKALAGGRPAPPPVALP